jgi:2-methylcitrate dehydratase PrpD
MSLDVKGGVATITDFIHGARVPPEASARAATAVKDTIGVMLAGVGEPAARIAQAMASEDGVGTCRVLGTSLQTSPELAALANGVSAHSLDYDDMCFVSLAHPSCALVPAILATGELVHARSSALLDAYVIGFELECRLGNVMNPRHYHQRGWHCTSSIGTVGAAAACLRACSVSAFRRRSTRWASRRHRRAA